MAARYEPDLDGDRDPTAPGAAALLPEPDDGEEVQAANDNGEPPETLAA
ncbi:hypothetical protein GCM10009087_17980 [Sphingomonas oligophenolica]|uniref:Uncharacterized protein n=1 Tax=Sphingomonas oligophenolica TaxID=301154 RepID=A0ABU9Y3G4_9SPHN